MTNNVLSTTKHIWFNSKLVGTIEDGKSYYQHADHLGSSSVETDTQGNPTELTSYYSFGQLHKNIFNINDILKKSDQRKYTSHELDQTTNLTYANQRYYNQKITRFISEDIICKTTPKESLIQPQSLNCYSYVLNNPYRYTDPSGDYFAQDYIEFTIGYAQGLGQGALDTTIATFTTNPLTTLQNTISFGKELGSTYRDLITNPTQVYNEVMETVNSSTPQEIGQKIGRPIGGIEASLAISAGVSKSVGAVKTYTTQPTYYRGGSSFQVRSGEVKIINGMVTNKKGVSINTDPSAVQGFSGGAHQITNLPKDLQIIQRGNKITHHEIVPKNPMTLQDYQKSLNNIKTKLYGK